MISTSKNLAILTLIFLSIFFLLVFRLDVSPPLWFDEGWVLSVSKNMAEQGHFGHISNDKLIPVSMFNVGISTVGPIAIIFKIWGVGVIQARLLIVCFAIGSFISLFFLSKNLYNPFIGIASVLLSVFFTIGRTNPIFIGRQVLGEMPALFFLLLGFLFLYKSWDNFIFGILGASLMWGLSLLSKSQVTPFLFISLVIPAVLSVIRRDWRTLKILGASLLILLLELSIIVGSAPLINKNLDTATQNELLNSTIMAVKTFFLTTSIPIRVIGVLNLFIFSLPLITSIIYISRQWLITNHKKKALSNVEITKLSLLTFSSSWLVWYALLSVGWSRYLFITNFIGSIFVAAMLSDFTLHFNIKYSFKQGNELLRHLKFNSKNFYAFLAILLFFFYVPISTYQILNLLISKPDRSLRSMIEFVSREIPQDALIETFDMELFPFLDRDYHFPPDIVQLQLNQRFYLRQDVDIEYNPLDVDPDYLVVGSNSREWGLYDEVLETGEFRLLKTYNQYEIFERVRN